MPSYLVAPNQALPLQQPEQSPGQRGTYGIWQPLPRIAVGLREAELEVRARLKGELKAQPK